MIMIFLLVMFLIVLPSSNVINVIKPASNLQQREKSVRFSFFFFSKRTNPRQGDLVSSALNDLNLLQIHDYIEEKHDKKYSI